MRLILQDIGIWVDAGGKKGMTETKMCGPNIVGAIMKWAIS